MSSPRRFCSSATSASRRIATTSFRRCARFRRSFRTTLVEPSGSRASSRRAARNPRSFPTTPSSSTPILRRSGGLPRAARCTSRRARSGSSRERRCSRGFALSDPYGLAASLAHRAAIRSLLHAGPADAGRLRRPRDRARAAAIRATDPELYRPLRVPRLECDVLFYGKWTPYRDALATALAARFRLKLHAYAGETRWSVPTLPPLDTPEALRAALSGARLTLETALLDDAQGKYRDAFRITPRAFFAASCGVPTLVEEFPRLRDFFEPGVEIATFTTPGTSLPAPGSSSPTKPRAAPWAAAPGSGPCGSTPGTAASRRSCSTSGVAPAAPAASRALARYGRIGIANAFTRNTAICAFVMLASGQ